MRSRKNTSETFWSRVKQTEHCWEWQGTISGSGYGTVWWDGKPVTAHRLAAFFTGLVESPFASKRYTDKTFVLHTCDNRRCCRPDHFFLGNYADNLRDAYNKRRRQQLKGEQNVNAKLTNTQVEKIRETYANRRLTQQQLADKYGVSQRSINLVVRNKTYVEETL